MSSNVDHEQIITAQPHSRKVSISTDPVTENRYDNLAYEPSLRRKISQVNTYTRMRQSVLKLCRRSSFDCSIFVNITCHVIRTRGVMGLMCETARAHNTPSMTVCVCGFFVIYLLRWHGYFDRKTHSMLMWFGT